MQEVFHLCRQLTKKICLQVLRCQTDCEKLKFQSQLCLLMTCLSIIHHVFPMELFCYNTSSQHPSISRHSEMRTKHQQHPRRNHVQDNPLNTLSPLESVFKHFTKENKLKRVGADQSRSI